jgi:hypothetical protein
MLAILMALSFYLQVIVSILILIYANGYFGFATHNPIIALPIFFMSVFAGVLCTRIQKGDFDAFQSMSICNSVANPAKYTVTKTLVMLGVR